MSLALRSNVESSPSVDVVERCMKVLRKDRQPQLLQHCWHARVVVAVFVVVVVVVVRRIRSRGWSHMFSAFVQGDLLRFALLR